MTPVTDSTRILIMNLDSMQTNICTFKAFAAANGDVPHVVDAVRNLDVCKGITNGGGAAPAFSITRFSI